MAAALLACDCDCGKANMLVWCLGRWLGRVCGWLCCWVGGVDGVCVEWADGTPNGMEMEMEMEYGYATSDSTLVWMPGAARLSPHAAAAHACRP